MDRSVRLRLRTSDLWTFDGIFVRREYDVPLPEDTRVVVDAGANVGLAALYFAWRFPAARVLALEPDPENFAQLCRNVAEEDRIEPVRAALWGREGRVRLTDPGGGAWALRTKEVRDGRNGGRREAEEGGGDGGAVRAVTLDTLLRSHDVERVDVLKLDIEGAEREVLAGASAWMDRVRAVVAELHESLAPGATAAFQAAVADFPFRWARGEYRVAAREGHPWPGEGGAAPVRRGGGS
jgi:FkbM family methyltransferase